MQKKEFNKIISIIDKIRPEKIGININYDGNVNFVGRNETLGVDFLYHSQIKSNQIKPVSINANLFANIIKKLDNDSEIVLEQKDNLFVIKTKKNRFAINVVMLEMPSEENKVSADTIELPFDNSKVLLNGLNKVSFACSRQQYRLALSGINLNLDENGKLSLIGLDGTRMSIFNENITNEKKNKHNMVLPNHSFICALDSLNKEEKINLYLASDNRRITMKDSDTIVCCSLLAVEYPDISKIVPNSDGIATIKISRKELINAINSVSIVANENNVINLKCEKDNNELTLSTSGNSIGQAKQTLNAIETSGDGVDIHCNYQYLLDALNIVEQEEITLRFYGNLRPICIKEQNLVEMITPMRV